MKKTFSYAIATLLLILFVACSASTPTVNTTKPEDILSSPAAVLKALVNNPETLSTKNLSITANTASENVQENVKAQSAFLAMNNLIKPEKLFMHMISHDLSKAPEYINVDFGEVFQPSNFKLNYNESKTYLKDTFKELGQPVTDELINAYFDNLTINSIQVVKVDDNNVKIFVEAIDKSNPSLTNSINIVIYCERNKLNKNLLEQHSITEFTMVTTETSNKTSYNLWSEITHSNGNTIIKEVQENNYGSTISKHYYLTKTNSNSSEWYHLNDAGLEKTYIDNTKGGINTSNAISEMFDNNNNLIMRQSNSEYLVFMPSIPEIKDESIIQENYSGKDIYFKKIADTNDAFFANYKNSYDYLKNKINSMNESTDNIKLNTDSKIFKNIEIDLNDLKNK